MKKLLITFATVLLSINSFGQISEVSQVESFELIGKTSNPYKWVKLKKSEDAYLITFLNLEYQNIVDVGAVRFVATPEDLTYLYDTLIDMCNSKRKTQKTLTLGTALVVMTTQGAKQVRLDVKQEGEPSKWTWLSRKQLSKVFKK